MFHHIETNIKMYQTLYEWVLIEKEWESKQLNFRRFTYHDLNERARSIIIHNRGREHARRLSNRKTD